MSKATTLVAVALALLVGIFVGGVGPRAELRRANQQLERARAELARGGGPSLPLALGMGSLLAGRDRARAGGAAAPVPRFVTPPPGEANDATHAGDRATAAEGAAARRPEDALAAARTAADLRAAQYRAAFLEQAGLSREAQAALDDSIAGMNRELGRVAGEAARALEARSKLSPRDMADIGARVLEVYRQADDRWKAGLDARARAALESTDFDLMTQIDLGVFEGLAGKLGAR
jgi:hypothetical protein